MKQSLDPHYYPLNYVPKNVEDAPNLANSLVAPPAKITEKKTRVEDPNKKNKGWDTKKEDKGNKPQAEDSVQEVDEDDYSDYSDLDYIYKKSAKKKKINLMSCNILSSIRM